MENSRYPSNQHQNHHDHESWLFSRTGLATVAAVSILGFLVYQGHGLHLLGYAPFLLIFACPLMHIFMHGGHHGHQGHQHGDHSEHSGHGGGCCGGSDSDEKSSETNSKGEK